MADASFVKDSLKGSGTPLSGTGDHVRSPEKRGGEERPQGAL